MTYAPRQLLPGGLAPAPLAMPDQSLTAPFRDPAAPGLRSGRGTLALRAVVLLAPLGAAGGLIRLALGGFGADGRVSAVEVLLALMSGFAFYWMVLSVATAALGLFWRPAPAARPLHGLRVAILLPMYGEEPEETIGTSVRLLAALAETGPHRFALCILSDSRAPGAALAEQAALRAARRRHPGLVITYRHRDRNRDFKSGNIRDWITASGHAHDAMLILDADSVMGPATVIRMADAMARRPGLGLIQTLPRILPGQTLWQGLQSFASETYGPTLGRGFAMWCGVEGNFLGHNALVRVAAFARSAGLPHLPGSAPRGGVILSHDFVEAALLRRAGWGVLMMPEAGDSHEDTPGTLIAHLRRDRRWCQGNLQHLRLLFVPGLHPLSRFHLLQGAVSYLASLWWLILLLLWALPGTTASLTPAADWPGPTQAGLAALIGATLLAPKLLGLVGHLRETGLTRAAAPGFAGRMLAEIVLSAVLAPALMLHQVRAVLCTLCGRDGGWRPHSTGRAGLGTLLRFHALESVLGAGLLVLALAGQISPWLLPIAASLCLTIPLAALVQMPRAAFAFRPKEGSIR